MREFLRTAFAVMFGIVLLLALALGAAYWKWGRSPSIEDDSILVQSVGGGLLEYPPGGYTSGMFAPSDPTLHAILDNLAKAAVDERIGGVVLRIGPPAAGYAMLDEIRAGVGKVRAAGKPVWAWSEYLDFKGLYLASACDSLFLFPTGIAELGGMYTERTYITGALEKLGITPDLLRIESYKSAAEMVTRTGMSPETREMVRWMLEDMYPRVLAQTAADLGGDEAMVTRALERGVMTPADAVGMGLAHGLRFWDEMKDALPRPDKDDEPRLLGGSEYAAVKAEDVGLKGKKKIAVVHAEGMIGGTKSGMHPLLGVMMGHKTVSGDLRRALDDDDVAAVVFRINSGGGSALTSAYIGRQVELVDREKPVVVSMVDVAASGGYDIAYPARAIVAGANTVTGSIGSITGKMVLRDFYGHIGVTKDTASVGPSPGFYSDYYEWSPDQRSRMNERHWQEYRTWITDIAAHRDLGVADVDSVARGRVWTGAQAVGHGLVDRLGNLDEAVALAKEEAGLEADEDVTLVHYPQPEGFLSQMLGMPMKAAAERMVMAWARERIAETDRMSRAELRILEVPVP